MKNTSVKPKGPVRTGMVLPSLILALLVYGYFHLFFDSHLRRGMEFAATRLYGAEINIAAVETSFLHASFRMRKLEVTDKEKPNRNLVQVGQIHFAALWDALLRGKIAIEDASVLEIQAYTPRKHPGFVLPPPPPSGPGILARAEEEVLKQTKAQMNQNFLGDVAGLVTGGDPKAQLQEIQGSLKAQARAEELAKELETKKAEWMKRISELPKTKDIDELQAKIKALDLKGGNPLQIAGKLKEAKAIVETASAKVRQVEQAQSQFTGDISSYNQSLADLEKLAQQDVSDLQRKLKLPSVDAREFSSQLFMTMIEKQLGGIRRYVEIARKYMPKKQSAAEKAALAQKAKEEELIPPARGEGRTYHFPITKGYPLFWLKKAAISSELSQIEWSGKVSGEILDLTTSPSQLGRPTKIHLAGNFPKQEIRGLDFLAVLDHTGEVAKESIRTKIESFPVTRQDFANSPEIRLGVDNATGSAQINASLEDSTLKISIGSKFDKPRFDFDAKSPVVKELLGNVLKGLPSITMNADVQGSWSNFAIHVNSNLGSELSAGFQKQVQAKIGLAKAQLDQLVSTKIGPAKKKVQDLLGSLSGGPGKTLAGQKEDMKKSLQKAQASATPSAGSPSETGKNLLKGFGF